MVLEACAKTLATIIFTNVSERRTFNEKVFLLLFCAACINSILMSLYLSEFSAVLCPLVFALKHLDFPDKENPFSSEGTVITGV